MRIFKPLLEAFRGKDNTVSTQTYELYSLIRRLDMEQLLKERGNFFEAHGNQARAKEYDQIYKNRDGSARQSDVSAGR